METTLRRPLQPMPPLVEKALAASGLTGAYEARPPYQRNDYLWWINTAKQQATKDRRLQKMLAELKQGHGYMGMAWTPPELR